MVGQLTEKELMARRRRKYLRTKHPTGCTDEDRAKAVNHAIYQGTKQPQWLIDATKTYASTSIEPLLKRGTTYSDQPAPRNNKRQRTNDETTSSSIDNAEVDDDDRGINPSTFRPNMAGMRLVATARHITDSPVSAQRSNKRRRALTVADTYLRNTSLESCQQPTPPGTRAASLEGVADEQHGTADLVAQLEAELSDRLDFLGSARGLESPALSKASFVDDEEVEKDVQLV
ncbi:hypothetical protein SCAR479_03762 [Seiridium cardinale]|uniref:Uncharacterized protein n=1 Tax=Seiridium cardinale TaxID=138064 RepID=A0ABR2XZS1_9PEZI